MKNLLAEEITTKAAAAAGLFHLGWHYLTVPVLFFFHRWPLRCTKWPLRCSPLISGDLLISDGFCSLYRRGNILEISGWTQETETRLSSDAKWWLSGEMFGPFIRERQSHTFLTKHVLLFSFCLCPFLWTHNNDFNNDLCTTINSTAFAVINNTWHEFSRINIQ